ncbi:hypothetical protein B0H17DRAFT_309610 [Mycena rosella]|uniref:Uncharacterized protein n=1 Tax=Mycena rosella TaxID=1033263 RepID=A0AAD7CUU7_MYCRO|nr:hypothetical protein B0H17DRAFT_309610 [Mycena rosella]
MKPKQPDSTSYHPTTSAPIEFQHTWRAVLVNPRNIGPAFPFRLPELVSNRHPIPYLEFRARCDPPRDIGNPGDIWLNVSPAACALFALSVDREWVRWPGATLDAGRMVPHPYLPLYALWCTIRRSGWYHRDKLPADWTDQRIAARRELGGYDVAADMADAAVGVRLVLLWEESGGAESDAVEAQLEGALGQLSATDNAGALVVSLGSGIDYLLAERMKLARGFFAAEERAAVAEQKLGEVSESARSISEYLATERTSLTSALAAAEGRAAAAEAKVAAAEEKLGAAEERVRALSQAKPEFTSTPARQTSGGLTLTATHLALLYRDASCDPDGGAKNCRICLTAVLPALLFAHALGAHPAECAVLAGAPTYVLEAHIAEFRELDR